MEDKWFIFFDDGWLYFHRAWRGEGIYKAQLHKKVGGYFIQEFWAERNELKWTAKNDEDDIETFNYLINCGLLGIDSRRTYIERNVKTDFDEINAWQKFGRMLYREMLFDNE